MTILFEIMNNNTRLILFIYNLIREMKVLRKLLWLWPTQQVSWFNEYKEEENRNKIIQTLSEEVLNNY